MENIFFFPRCSNPAPKSGWSVWIIVPGWALWLCTPLFPCVRADKASEVVSCGVWLGLVLSSQAPTSGPCSYQCSYHSENNEAQDQRMGLEHQTLPLFPQGTRENLRRKAEARSGTKRLPSRAMDVWNLHCLFNTAVKNTDCRLESCLCEAEGQHFDGIIFTQMHACMDYDEWNCNTETSVQFLHRVQKGGYRVVRSG